MDGTRRNHPVWLARAGTGSSAIDIATMTTATTVATAKGDTVTRPMASLRTRTRSGGSVRELNRRQNRSFRHVPCNVYTPMLNVIFVHINWCVLRTYKTGL